jgi:hypothetical protein
MNDGSLRFRVSYYYEDKSEKFDEILQAYLKRALGCVEMCMPGILSIIFAKANPEIVYHDICRGVDASLN